MKDVTDNKKQQRKKKKTYPLTILEDVISYDFDIAETLFVNVVPNLSTSPGENFEINVNEINDQVLKIQKKKNKKKNKQVLKKLYGLFYG